MDELSIPNWKFMVTLGGEDIARIYNLKYVGCQHIFDGGILYNPIELETGGFRGLDWRDDTDSPEVLVVRWCLVHFGKAIEFDGDDHPHAMRFDLNHWQKWRVLKSAHRWIWALGGR